VKPLHFDDHLFPDAKRRLLGGIPQPLGAFTQGGCVRWRFRSLNAGHTIAQEVAQAVRGGVMTSAGTAKVTLFDRIGGQDGIRNLVDDFYERVLADPKLGPFFENTPMERLRNMQYEFFAAALDGPSNYKGKQLSYVHFGRGIGREHFGRFIDRLFDTLKSYELDDDTLHAIIGRLNLYADEITGSTADAE
jgi:hemoglobin